MTNIVKNMQATNLITWLETQALSELGTDNQRERYFAGVLPDDEIAQLARGELFKGFETFTRWHNRDGRKEMVLELSAKHAADCPLVRAPNERENRAIGAIVGHNVVIPGSRVVPLVPGPFDVEDVGELTAEQWERLKQITAIARSKDVHPWMIRQAATATVATFSVWLTCTGCEVEAVRSIAKVEIPWAGRTLTREFQL